MITLKVVYEITFDPIRLSEQTEEGLEKIFRSFLSEEPLIQGVFIKNVESQKLIKAEIKDD